MVKEDSRRDFLPSILMRNPYLRKDDQRDAYLRNFPTLGILLHEEGTYLIVRVSIGKRTEFVRFHL